MKKLTCQEEELWEWYIIDCVHLLRYKDDTEILHCLCCHWLKRLFDNTEDEEANTLWPLVQVPGAALL